MIWCAFYWPCQGVGRLVFECNFCYVTEAKSSFARSVFSEKGKLVLLMEYAIQLFLPVLGGLLLGNWLSKIYGVSPLWTPLLAILGMFSGLAILYKRYVLLNPTKTTLKKKSQLSELVLKTKKHRKKETGGKELLISDLDALYHAKNSEKVIKDNAEHPFDCDEY